jgi:acyl homoserine lactone synthase
MIDFVTWENRHLFADDLAEMHRLRYRIFHEKLGWEVSVRDGTESDEFDQLPGTAYLLYRDQTGAVKGCARLLPTTGPNMLRDVFPVLLDGTQAPCAPRIWESTRFAVEDGDDHRNAGLSQGTRELLVGMTEIALAYGLKRVISVCDIRVERVLKHAGLPTIRIGKSARIGVVAAVAGYYEPGPAVLDALMKEAGLSESVIASAPWIDTRRVA